MRKYTRKSVTQEAFHFILKRRTKLFEYYIIPCSATFVSIVVEAFYFLVSGRYFAIKNYILEWDLDYDLSN